MLTPHLIGPTRILTSQGSNLAAKSGVTSNESATVVSPFPLALLPAKYCTVRRHNEQPLTMMCPPPSPSSNQGALSPPRAAAAARAGFMSCKSKPISWKTSPSMVPTKSGDRSSGRGPDSVPVGRTGPRFLELQPLISGLASLKAHIMP